MSLCAASSRDPIGNAPSSRPVNRTRPTIPGPAAPPRVHGTPADEARKGSGAVAAFGRGGAGGVPGTFTGGERGSILNPAMDRPAVTAHLAGIRHQEMERAIAILGAHHAWLG